MSPARALARPRWAGLLALCAVLPLLALAAPGRAAPSATGAVPAETGRAEIPAYAGYVTDAAGVLSEERRAQLESFLDQVHQKTGAQFAVLTVKSTDPEDPYAYKVRVFEAWGIGSKEEKDGLLLVVAMEQHSYLFETGYGLEGTLPDGWLSTMYREVVKPLMQAGDVDGGVTAGLLAAAQRVAAEKGVTLEWDGRELRYDTAHRKHLPSWAVLLLLFLLLLLFSTAARRGRYYGGPFIGGGFGGGWGGGFGGGGGGFGGGGSFGGFGGGSSGGGGGGGSW